MALEFTPYPLVMKGFGSRLRALRVEKGLGQNDLARIAGIHPMQVSKYEREERSPSADNLLALAKALGVTVDRLLTGDEDAKAPTREVYRFPLLIDRAKQIDRELDRKDAEAIISLLDAYLAKRRIKKLVNE